MVGASRRVAALAAFACFAAGLVVVAVAAVRGDAWRAAAAAAAVASATVGLWYVASRRGLARAVGAVVAAASVVALLAVVLNGPYRGVPLAISLGLVALSAGAARYALGRDPSTLKAAPLAGEPVARAVHPVLLVNPRSGGGKGAGLVEVCRSRGIRVVVLQPGEDVARLAEDSIDEGADVIGVAGGDGSQALVAGVAASRDVAFVCVPAGTRNHFALDLGLDREDVVGALDAFDAGVERRIDLARVNGRVFVNNASMGLYARVVQSQDYRDAKLRTALRVLPDLLGPDAEPLDLRFIGPDGTEHSTAQLLLVSNDAYELDRAGGRGTRERLDRGVLGIASLETEGAADVVAFAGLEAAGQARHFDGLAAWTAPRFTVDSAGPVEVGVDGEALVLLPPLVFESLPGALRVRLPNHAPGLAPVAASAHLSRSTVRDLLAVARGPLTPGG